jgi:hypothetical protein
MDGVLVRLLSLDVIAFDHCCSSGPGARVRKKIHGGLEGVFSRISLLS